ncbi:DHCW motif cupin fold protein [Billgrantia sp. Q4P2]|uniref:DHCW motif cupin fold protein n=1 Tax=Billgrantia sp. Q4P2 TaxID=3463857 RepID=UPI0040563FB0
MVNPTIAFQTIDWKSIARTEHKGETGIAYWQTVEFEGLRIRHVEYSKNYTADHWCQKGHIVYCLKGEVVNELEDGSRSILREGMSYVVSDGLSSHRSITTDGVHLLIIDGDFLNPGNN